MGRYEDAIYDFFSEETKPQDTLLMYFSGHGVLDIDGDVYLATSETEAFWPSRRGFNFNELTKLMKQNSSTRIVIILDCCYSGSAKISKGHEGDAAKLGASSIDNGSQKLRGEGKCILAASQAQQEAYSLEEQNHSLFTFYLLQALRGEHREAVDNEGYLTVDSLSKYLYDTIMSLPPAKRPKQKPIRKLEASGDIVLGYFPEFSRKKDDIREATRSLIRAADRSKSEEDLHIETEHILRNFFSSTGHDYDPHHNVTIIRGRPDTLYGWSWMVQSMLWLLE
jgi:Caspase domain